MNYEVILTSVLTSAVVSTGIGAILKYHFDSRLLELKAASDFAEDWATQRNEAIKQLGDLVYRTRNAAREVTNDKESLNGLERLVKEQESLQEALFTYRVLLEREELFAVAHRYRTKLKNLENTIGALQKHDTSEARSKLLHLADTIFEAIDAEYLEIVSIFQNSIGSSRITRKRR